MLSLLHVNNGIPLGGGAIMKGSFQKHVKKISPHKITIEIKRTKLQAVSLSSGFTAASVTLSHMKKKGLTFNF